MRNLDKGATRGISRQLAAALVWAVGAVSAAEKRTRKVSAETFLP